MLYSLDIYKNDKDMHTDGVILLMATRRMPLWAWSNPFVSSAHILVCIYKKSLIPGLPVPIEPILEPFN
jgi:hypothetical protein